MGLRTEGPSLIVTDLCTMRPDPESKEFEVVTLHPGVTRTQSARTPAGRFDSPGSPGDAGTDPR